MIARSFDTLGMRHTRAARSAVATQFPASAYDRHSKLDEVLQSEIDCAAANIAIVDLTGLIVGVNASWRSFATKHGNQDVHCGIGSNYFDICEQASNGGCEEARLVAEGIRDVMKIIVAHILSDS